MMEGPFIFLDIDGVLNGHNFNKLALSNIIDAERVELLNEILLRTDAKIILSSSWRYMIHGNAMTLLGFEYLLRTHGVIAGRLIGATCLDETMWDTRGKQIAHFRQRYLPDHAKCVILDDGDDEDTYGLLQAGIPWVRTNSKIGLTCENIYRVVEILGEKSVD